MMVGEVGMGKCACLMNSGLEFRIDKFVCVMNSGFACQGLGGGRYFPSKHLSHPCSNIS